MVAGLALCLAGSAGVQASDDAPPVQAPVREVAIRAEQFVFTPNDIEVTEGETVRLVVEAVDVPHGIAIPDLGISVVARPGGEPAVVEFQADTPGRFQFACAVFCGAGHGRMTGILTVVPASGVAPGEGPDRVSDQAVDVVEPDFNLTALPTTLRLPHGDFAFRLTHRFSRPLDGGPGYGNFAEDFFGFDSTAFIGLELRYGIAPGTQIGIYRNNNRNIQIFGKYNILWQGHERGVGLDAYVSVEGFNNLRDEQSPAFGFVLSKRFTDRAAVYVEPIWVGNSNKRLIHPELGFVSDRDDSLLLGLGTRTRASAGVGSVLICRRDELAKFQRLVRDTCLHRGRDPQALVNPAEVVVGEVQAHCRLQVLDLLAEGVREPREAPHRHPHRQILPLDM